MVKTIQLCCLVSDREVDFYICCLVSKNLDSCGLRAEVVTVASMVLLLIRTVQYWKQVEVEFYGKIYFYIKAM